MTFERLLVSEMPLAFALFEILTDSRNEVVDFRFLEVNTAFSRMFGIEERAIVQKTMSFWLTELSERGTKWLEDFAEATAQGQKKEFDEVLEHRGRWYVVTAYTPSPGYLAVFFHDAVRFRKATDDFAKVQNSLSRSLETSRALARNIFENAPVAIVSYEVMGDGSSGQDYIVRSANSKCLEAEGWTQENVLGRPLNEVRPGIDAFGIIPVFQRVWKTGETVRYPTHVYREAGDARWVENTVFRLPSGEIVATYQDITEKQLAEQSVFEEKERLKVTLHSIGDGVITTNRLGKIEVLNEAAEAITGWSLTEAEGQALALVLVVRDENSGEIVEDMAETVLRSGNMLAPGNPFLLRTKSGDTKVISASAAPIKDEDGGILGVVLVLRDLTEIRKTEGRIRFLSYRDPLTGLYNRRFFERELKRLDSENKLPATIVAGDLDGLRLINNVFGHEAGDEALIRTAGVYTSLCREGDVISRWSGNLFLAVLPGKSMLAAQPLCDKIHHAVSQITVSGTRLSISMGCATKVSLSQTWEEVITKAEDNMHRAKMLGAKSYRSVILSAMKNALFEKSYETQEHGDRIGRFCREIGKTMGLSSSQIDELEVLATLHDIGKIGIDEQILRKPAALTPKEWVVMKTHPEIGYRIAKTVPELQGIAEGILAHHERWDGQGYPRGLSGTRIPLLSRILAVADAYDAMTQGRPYRKALSKPDAIKELESNAGTQFDPNIVPIFVAHLEEQAS